VEGATLGVCKAGPPACGYTSIQAALEQAGDGDEILVGDGDYRENIDFKGKAVHLLSVNGAAVTTIRAALPRSVVSFRNSEGPDAVLEGFTITGGIGSSFFMDGGESDSWGGGILSRDASPTIVNCTITGNSAYYGAGIWAGGFSGAADSDYRGVPHGITLRGCSITGNRGGRGAMLRNATVLGCAIRDNLDGGGLEMVEGVVEDTSITGNCAKAPFVVGGIVGEGFVARRVLVAGNSGPVAGGARLRGGTVFLSSTFADNEAEGVPGVLLSAPFEQLGLGLESFYFLNTIFWHSGVSVSGSVLSRFVYCDVEGGAPGPGRGNIDADPLFVDPAVGNYRLRDDSPCREGGHPRRYDADGSRADMGAFGADGGSAAPRVLVVDLLGSGDFTSLEDAVESAVPGDEIVVSPGTYREALFVVDKLLTIRAGGGEPVVLDGGGVTPLLIVAGGAELRLEGVKLQNGIYSAVRVLAASLALQDCEISGNVQGHRGAGISAQYARLQINRSRITGNHVMESSQGDSGGGIWLLYSVASIVDTLIADNSAPARGGGICAAMADVLIEGSTVLRNQAAGGGGLAGGSFAVRRSMIAENRAVTWYGGGIVTGGAFTLEDSEVSGNRSYDYGGGLHLDRAEGVVRGCAIRGNTSGRAGGIELWKPTRFVVENTVISGNGGAEVGGVQASGLGLLMVVNSTIAGNGGGSIGGMEVTGVNMVLLNSIVWGNEGTSWRGNHDLDFFEGYPPAATLEIACSSIGDRGGVDPLFVNPRPPLAAATAADDYHLRVDSPLIDAGCSDARYPDLPSRDLDGDPRPIGAGFDVGADEFDLTKVPAALEQSASVLEDGAASITLAGTPVGADPLEFVLVSRPAHGTLTGEPPNLVYEPSLNYAGPDEFTFRAIEGARAGRPATVHLTVDPVNDPPAFQPVAAASGWELVPMSFTVAGTDVEGDALSYAAVSLPPGAVFDAGTRTFTWDPRHGQHGTWSAIFETTDSGNPPRTVRLEVPITVRPVLQYDDFADATAAGDADWLEERGDWHAGPRAGFCSMKSIESLALSRDLDVQMFSAGRIEALVKLDDAAGVGSNASFLIGVRKVGTRYRYRSVTLAPRRLTLSDSEFGTMASRAVFLKTGRFYRVVIDVFPSGRVLVSVDGRPVLSRDLSPLRAGLLGVKVRRARTCFDDFTVWDPSVLSSR
jgi:hypothetical protein